MATRKPSGSRRTVRVRRGSLPKSGRELVVVTKPEAGLRARPEGIMSITGESVQPLEKLLESQGARLRPLFGNEDRVRLSLELAPVSALAEPVPDLTTYYLVEAPEKALDGLAEEMLGQDLVDAAYVKPPASPPFIYEAVAPPSPEEAPATTPDFRSRQLYLDPAPGGIDARFAWTIPGGKGQNVRIIDIEGAWRFSHEDLLQNQGGVAGGTQFNNLGWRNHGTAVVGEFGADENEFGVTGICSQANVRAVAIDGPGSAGAIRQAAMALGPGDIILIELHRPGPRFNFQMRPDQKGFIAVEFWPDDFAAISFAVNRGVIVVEAAGNGAENLDDPIYNARPSGFPINWKNPFNPANPSSGAILAGAGAPPPGTHNRNHGADRSRLDFSNYGARLDVQGWGREVTTSGYGDLQGGSNEDLWYTDTFSGTSSASPIIVGALGCVQGALRSANKPPLTPAKALELMRTTGSPQQDQPGRPASQRIGNRPDLKQAFERLELTQPGEGDGGGDKGTLEERLERLEKLIEELLKLIKARLGVDL